MTLLYRFRSFSRNARLFLAAILFVGLALALNTLFLNFYLQALGFSQQFIGLVNAIPTAALMVVGIPVGRLIDRQGPRWGLIVGTAAAALGSMIVALGAAGSVIVGGAFVLGIGSAFGFISGAPFLMAHSTERNRVALFSAQAALVTATGFLGNLAGGWLPRLFSAWLRATPGALAPLRGTMIVVAAMWVASIVPLAAVRERATSPSPAPTRTEGAPWSPAAPVGDGTAPARRRFVSQPGLVARLLLPSLLISLGAGQTLPFLNIYISGKFGVDYASLGTLFAVGALGTTVATLAQPGLAERVGRIQSVLAVQIASLPFLLALGFAPVFWMVAASFVVRIALMNMGNPVYQAFAQEQIPPGERATFSSLSSVAWSLGWSAGAAFSGWWRGRVGFAAGFDAVFGLMTVLYTAAIALIYVFFIRRRGVYT
jgi:MFS family permease